LSRRTRGTNAFRASTTGLVTAGTDVVPLDTVVNLSVPGYMTLSPFSATLREVIKYEDINGNNLESLTRGLPGSVGDVAHEHQSLAVVISAPTQQVTDDLFTDIEDLEAGAGSWGPADAAHEAANDPHAAAYVNKAGGIMTGELTLPSGTPSGNAIATTKGYVDQQISGGGLPSGVRMIFDMDTAPTGWTRDTSTVNDKMIMIVTGARGVDDGTWSQPGHIHGVNNHDHTGPSHTHSGPNHTHSVIDHTHGVGSHNHTTPNTGAVVAGGTATAQENGGANFEYAIGSHVHTMANTGSAGAGSTNPGGNNTQAGGNSATGAGGTGNTSSTAGATGNGGTDPSWRPLHRDMIIAVKDV
jgi:hypothetical protein